MKYILILLGLFSFSLSAYQSQTYDACSKEEGNLHKLTVDLSQISFNPDGIYCCYRGHVFKVHNIEFVNGEYKIVVPRGVWETIFGVWFCSCGQMNSKYDKACSNPNCRKLKPRSAFSN